MMGKELSRSEKAEIMKKEYMRKWRKENPEKIKQYQEKHFAKKYDEMRKEAQ